MFVESERETKLSPSGRDEKLSRKKITQRSGGSIRKQGNRVCRRREQKELKGPQIQNSCAVIEQMFERRASGTRGSVLGTTSLGFLLLLIFLCLLKSIVQFLGARLTVWQMQEGF